MVSSSALIRKLLSQTAIYGMSSMLGRLLNYLLVPLYTRLFTTAEYGSVTELYSYVGFLMVLYTYGMETAFFRYAKNAAYSPNTVYSTAQGVLAATTAAFTVLLLAAVPQLSVWLGYGGVQSQYLVYIVLILALDTLAALPFAYLRYHEQARRFAAIRLAGIGLNIALNLFFLLLCPRWQHYTWVGSWYNAHYGLGYIFLSNLLSSAVVLLLLLPQLWQWRWSQLSGALLRTMLAYGLPLVVVGLAGSINEMLDRVILKYLLPYDAATNMAQLGIYGACYKLSILMTLFTQAFKLGSEPFFFAQAGAAHARQLYATVTQYFTIVGLAIFLGVMLFIDPISHFIGKDYRAGLAVVPILLMANLCLGIYYNVSVWYKNTDRTAAGATISVLGAVITVVLNIALVPLYGYMGAAWATLACYTAMLVVSYGWGQLHYPVPYRWLSLVMYTMWALALWAAELYAASHFTANHAFLFYGLKITVLALFLATAYIAERRARVGSI